ncbi:MAG: 3-isopropylmalate dehydratase small subunit [Nitrospirae bacterium]|nr:3-isopropylmalate dehydratase small subunit [Nitrospirota bacterium]
MILKGRIWKFGDNINTDLIIPARYLNTTDPAELALHLMEDEDPEFAKKIKPGDIIVAGKNFGCGSSREHAPIAIKESGIQAVLAESFARIFYRNAFNIGLPIFESSGVWEGINEGDDVEIHTDKGIIKDLTRKTEFMASPIPPFMEELISSGGLMEWVKTKLKLTSS